MSLHQTTRLRAIAEIDGHATDVSELSVDWASSDQDLLRVEGTGLVQCIRRVPGEQTITATLPNGLTTSVSVTLK